jgi:large subunit ribosomal protein L21
VLLVGSKTATILGKPLVAGQTVTAVVEEVVKDKKVITLKFRRRKNSKNIRGFRRQLTILRVKEITLDADVKKDLGL